MAFDKRDQHSGPPVREREGAEYRNQPASRDVAVWDDECNFETHLASKIPMDGLDLSVEKLFGSRGIEKR